MDYKLRNRAKLFSEYVCAELKGSIVSHGFSQGAVADGIGRQKANLSRWLNAKPPIPIDVASEICTFIGEDLQAIVDRASTRVNEKLGEYSSVPRAYSISSSALTDDERIARAMKKASEDDVTLAANNNPDKEAEAEHDADAGA